MLTGRWKCRRCSARETNTQPGEALPLAYGNFGHEVAQREDCRQAQAQAGEARDLAACSVRSLPRGRRRFQERREHATVLSLLQVQLRVARHREERQQRTRGVSCSSSWPQLSARDACVRPQRRLRRAQVDSETT